MPQALLLFNFIPIAVVLPYTNQEITITIPAVAILIDSIVLLLSKRVLVLLKRC